MTLAYDGNMFEVTDEDEAFVLSLIKNSGTTRRVPPGLRAMPRMTCREETTTQGWPGPRSSCTHRVHQCGAASWLASSA